MQEVEEAQRSSRLRLVRGEVGAAAPSPAMALHSPSCRPGELPTQVVLELTPEARARAREASAVAGISVPLWIRLAVEATRQIERAAERLEACEGELCRALDEAASAVTGETTLAAAPLSAYSRSLTLGRCASEPFSGRRINLWLPDELYAAWSLEASRAGGDLGGWASSMLLGAPPGVVEWERAAARGGFYLAEWMLLEAASAQRCSARPHL